MKTPPAHKNNGRDERILVALTDFREIVNAAKRHFISAHEKAEISGAQLWALRQIRQSPGVTVLALAQKMAVLQPTASNLIEKLESGGYVRKDRDIADRRIVHLFATPSGLRILKKAPNLQQDVLPNAISRLSDDELNLLEQAFTVLSQKIGVSSKDTSK